MLYNSCHDKTATFSCKSKQNSDEIALINMRCKQRRLGDLIYKYNSDHPTSSCQLVVPCNK